jgi:hypothetical protein
MIRTIFLVVLLSSFAVKPFKPTLLSYRQARRFITKLDEPCLYSRNNMSALDPFDCEHVIPRSFLRNKTIESDMHIMFKCTPKINRERGNKPFDDTIRKGSFQVADPFAKAVVSRTCLYYLDRYLLEHVNRNLDSFFSSVIDEQTLCEWYRFYGTNITNDDRRRNWLIYRSQGTFNPYTLKMITRQLDVFLSDITNNTFDGRRCVLNHDQFRTRSE